MAQAAVAGKTSMDKFALLMSRVAPAEHEHLLPTTALAVIRLWYSLPYDSEGQVTSAAAAAAVLLSAADTSGLQRLLQVLLKAVCWHPGLWAGQDNLQQSRGVCQQPTQSPQATTQRITNG